MFSVGADSISALNCFSISWNDMESSPTECQLYILYFADLCYNDIGEKYVRRAGKLNRYN